MKKLLVALLALIAASPAFGQALLQGGAWTQGHGPMYSVGSNSQPIVQDSGPAGGGAIGLGLSEQLLSVRSVTNSYPAANAGTGPLNANWCDYDAPTTNATGYHYLCMSPNAQGGGLIAYGFGGGASSLPFTFNINGTSYQFPFTTTGVIGPGSSTVNDVACWNNTAGTLLKDCGAAVSTSSNNTWTGTNNFTGPFQISGTAQTFPASGLLVGTADTQTLTNKSINASEVNSGVLGGAQMPALTGDVISAAGSVFTTISAGVVTNSKLAVAGSANTIKGAATSTSITDLAVPSCSSANQALQWVTGTGLQCATVSASTAGFGINLSAGVFSISTSQPPYGFDVPINLGLSSAAAGSNLTITMTGANGSNPSSTNPVLVPFRSGTPATGTPLWAIFNSATSLVIPSGATLGTTNNVPFRIWIFASYNGGSPQLGAATCSNTTTIFPCSGFEYRAQPVTTISGLATSSGVVYVPSSVGNDLVRIIGFCDFSSGLATVGAWTSACTTLQLFGPGIKKPGDVVQTVMGTRSSTTSTASTTFVTSNISASITPTAAPNLVMLAFNSDCTATNGTAQVMTYQLTRGATQIGQPQTVASGTPSATTTYSCSMGFIDAPGVVTSTAYAPFFKTSVGQGASLPVTSGTIIIQEIMGALEPANDNGQPLTMTG